ncbi:NAD(P)/FAD-dependent oxidoreductase [Haladaptatus sp. CMSO5]|uniref:NAD(P)/FAD-dependent oxidoreductase n=1 Tax=Haladaptatus sp. CMSO5 TaxID=3120514 RepID=UPI002FCE3567
MSARDPTRNTDRDYDVAIVGGGPAGCSVGVFTARYGLDTAIFDRGNSSIRQCAHLANFLGFPAGIDVGTFYELIHDHAEEAGCTLIPDHVEAVTQIAEGFLLETQDGRAVTARRVVAAARYDAAFLESLDVEEMFEAYERDGEEKLRFDRTYPAVDGSTSIAGLYVASPVETVEPQALISAGHGARVARTLLTDVRCERGFPPAVAGHWDWVRGDSTLQGEWGDRETWREWFHDRIPADYPVNDARLEAVREEEIDRRLATYISDEEVARRKQRGHARLLEHVDDDCILDAARKIEATREADETGT